MRSGSNKLRAMLPLQKTTPDPCWLGIRFPHLALDLFTRGQARNGSPIAVSEPIKRRELIIDCNPAALAGGVKAGMPATAALGLMDTLQVVERDTGAEQRALQRLAAWCYQYSNQVSIPADRSGLFLEAGASERLFGRPQILGTRLELELGQLGYHAMTGSAPSPEAAWLAACEGLHICSAGHIRQQVGPLPLGRLHLDAAQQLAMQRMGFRQVRDLFRLPRKALTRRFGPTVTAYLDRLLGIQADPRPLYQPPETFTSRMDLPAEITASQALLFPLKRLLEELCGVLRGGDTAAQSLQIVLGHEDHEDTLLELGLQSPTQVELGLQSPTQDPARLVTVLRERLERLRLPQAVREIRLEAPQLLKFSAGQHSLFMDTTAEQQQGPALPASRITARNTAGAPAHWMSKQTAPHSHTARAGCCQNPNAAPSKTTKSSPAPNASRAAGGMAATVAATISSSVTPTAARCGPSTNTNPAAAGICTEFLPEASALRRPLKSKFICIVEPVLPQ